MEQVGFFIGTLRGTKARDAFSFFLRLYLVEACGGAFQRLVPCGFAEVRQDVSGIDVQPFGRRVLAADERFGQSVWVINVVESEPSFYAETLFIGRAVCALNVFDLIIFDLKGELTTDAAVRTDGLDFTVIVGAVAALSGIHDCGWHQRACRTSLHTFAASHAT